MNLSKIVVITMFALAASIGPVLAAWTPTDTMDVVTDNDNYLTTNTIFVGAKFTNTSGQNELIGDVPYPGGFTATLNVTPVGGAAPVYTAQLKLTAPNQVGGGGVVIGHSSAVIATTVIPANILKPGTYLVSIICNLEGSTFPPSLVFQAVPSKVIRVNSGSPSSSIAS